MIKRILCFILLILLLTFPASAALDGVLNARTEYKEQHVELQSDRHISNNALRRADLYWFADVTNYSLYLGLQYDCKDHSPDIQYTGVEVTINGVLCATFYADGTISEVDSNFFDVDSFFRIQDTAPKAVIAELRIGIKYGFSGNITAGIRILDFSGKPSNYYEQLVYSPEPVTEEVTTKAAPETTTKSTTSAAQSTTATMKRTTKPVILAATGTTKAPTTTKAPKTTKATTTKPPKTTRPPKTTNPTNTENEATSTDPITEAETTTQEFLTSTEAEASATNSATYYATVDRLKIIGTAVSSILITSAVMVWLYYAMSGMRRKRTGAKSDNKED